MSGLLLSDAEIQDITGLTQPAAQERFLRTRLKVPAFRNAANQVIVFRSQVDRQAEQSAGPPVPDFEALDRIK